MLVPFDCNHFLHLCNVYHTNKLAIVAISIGGLFWSFNCSSQKKAVKSKHREMLEDKLTALQESEDDNKHMDVSKSDDSDSEAESKDDSSEDDGAALVVPTSDERKVSITLTSSPVPSNTFITDQFKSTDPSVVRLIHIKYQF